MLITGVGLGLRFKYLDNLLNDNSPIAWFELLADHFHDLSNPHIPKINKLLESYPCVMHSVNLSLASSDPLNEEYYSSLKKVAYNFKPQWISDHLCFTNVGSTYLHDLLPFPFTYGILDHIANKIDRIQSELKLPFLIENISSYMRFKHSEMTEAEFIAELTKKTGCKILLDINNIVVTCYNHNESIDDFCKAVPFENVMQIHLAGALAKDNLLIDTHSRPISNEVLLLYKMIIRNYGIIPTCLEWDMDLPEFDQIIKEVNKIDTILAKKG